MRTILLLTLLLSAVSVYAGGFNPDQAASFPGPDFVAVNPDQVMKPQVSGGVQFIAGTTYIACGTKDLRKATEWTWNEDAEKCIEIEDVTAAN